ncbi:MAG: Rab family GTPase [Promethearchaeota archaeon]|jgi:small GTP-binding protein
MKKTIKIIVSGDGGVGKTSFLNRLINDFFDPNSKLTKGVDFFSKDVFVNGNEYNIILWDFAGQQQFKKLLSDFVNGSFAAFILFDLSRFNTIEGVEEWINKLDNYGKIPVFIVGTKRDTVDLRDTRAFDDYIAEIIKNNKNVIGCLNISSKTGFNVERAFTSLIDTISN